MEKYKVILAERIDSLFAEIEVVGHLECRQMASLVFTDNRGTIVRAFAPGTWKSVEIIYES